MLDNLTKAQKKLLEYDENDFEYYFYKQYIESHQFSTTYLEWLKSLHEDESVSYFFHYIKSNSESFWRSIELDSSYDILGGDIERYQKEVKDRFGERTSLKRKLGLVLKSYQKSLDLVYDEYDKEPLSHNYQTPYQLEADLPSSGERPWKIEWKNESGEVIGRDRVLFLNNLKKGITKVSFEVKDFDDNHYLEKIYINTK